jgi:hypothetical protein
MIAEGVLDTPDRDTLAQMLFGAITAGVLRLARSDDLRAEVELLRNVAIQIMLGMMSEAS